MGQLSRAILYGCLEALKFMLWLCAGLVFILIGVEHWRGEPYAQPGAQAVLAAGFLAGGFLCRLLARLVARST